MADLYQERLARLKALCGEKPPMMLTLRQASQVLHVHRDTLVEHIRRGYFKGATKVGERWLLPTNEVLHHPVVMGTLAAWAKLQDVLSVKTVIEIDRPLDQYRVTIKGVGGLYVTTMAATLLIALTEALEEWPE